MPFKADRRISTYWETVIRVIKDNLHKGRHIGRPGTLLSKSTSSKQKLTPKKYPYVKQGLPLLAAQAIVRIAKHEPNR
ncbi:hypothetical protein DSO57_1039301 [Entomophthora muscae]|uniref:Uncharacterized protein n=1 Tax=Entomophthora muscae TaxID=34485 RepID=A0ACC2RPE6_9FUNG|nr:hypothetical protein DSO57_1039301 [Entomophthora muscae]